MSSESFRSEQPVAWAFHRNTSRWAFNVLEPDEAHEHPLPPKEYTEAPYHPLPEPRLPETALGTALRARLSCRQFAEAELSQQAVADLLYAGCGVLARVDFGNVEFLERPIPSGGALYPLELYLLARAVEGLEVGIYHYAVITHGLEEVRRLPLPRGPLGYLFMGQHYVGSAAAILVITAVVHRSLRKYGDRGYRYLLLEAGHLAQNINLVAAASNLGALNLGGFFDAELAELLALDVDTEIPLYAIALGRPTTTDRLGLRRLPSEF